MSDDEISEIDSETLKKMLKEKGGTRAVAKDWIF